MTMQENNLAVRATANVAAPVERVWQVLTDLHGYEQWHPSVELVDGPPAAEMAKGSVLRLRADRGTPAEREFDVTVTELTAPTVLAWEGGDPEHFFGRHRFTLAQAAEGTDFTDEETFEGSMAEAVLAEHRTALEAAYKAGAEALKQAAEK
ncbi:SRPBCC domain-containing protein [Streptomyces daqingensis]|uniref:SRPBCC domain-containing protein n=1 Tax=Streptomyces daqingensis TaxID=1472640 RepID=UPI001664FA3C|nr:SRPBCC domain-containing protein [Streptomyces daqingensis]